MSLVDFQKKNGKVKDGKVRVKNPETRTTGGPRISVASKINSAGCVELVSLKVGEINTCNDKQQRSNGIDLLSEFKTSK